MTSCMDLMEQINRSRSTHSCPQCHQPSYCAIEDGKSANTCWCMGLPAEAIPNTQLDEECLCRQCLTQVLKTPTATVTGIMDASRGRYRE